MTTIHINHWEIILSTTLLMREEQEAKIVLMPDDPLTIRVRFRNEPPTEGEKLKTTLSVEGEGNDGVLVFTNWNHRFGTANKDPLEFAEDDQGRSIAVQSSVLRIGDIYQVFLQFMREVQRDSN